jgi:UDPglucose 6-dehydrogenase
MNSKINIGIIGFGFVGSAVAFGFSPQTGCEFTDIRIYDKDKKKSKDTLKEVSSLSEIIFLSVPTPARIEDGAIDLKILDSVLNDISNNLDGNSPIVLIRSTVIPGTCRDFQKKYSKLKIVFNPEFLTERSAKLDFINQARVVLGGNPDDTKYVANLFLRRFGRHLPIIETDFETAELIKYMCNCFFATKVSFMNEMYRVSEAVGAEWPSAVEGFQLDGSIGKSHLTVPGFDGKFGYSGSCFPKDVQAMINFGKKIGINVNTVEGGWKTNLEVRPEKDWEKLKGRAVSESE